MTVLKELTAVLTIPYATPSGRIVTSPGYDPDTGVYLDIPPSWVPRVPDSPTEAEIRKAAVTLIRPWREYKFHERPDRVGACAGALFSAVLTAVCRPLLDIAPGIFFDASEQASGKTQAALALGAVMTGSVPGVTPFAGKKEADLGKFFIAAALAGDPFLCFDNVTGILRSSAIAGILTSSNLKDRVLSVSQTFDGPYSPLMTFTGNNGSLDRDINSRVLRVRLDGGREPGKRRFGFTPQGEAVRTRREIADAACTIWRGFFSSGFLGSELPASRGFVQWDKLCRFPVLWLAQRGLDVDLPWRLGDPSASMLDTSAGDDPDEQNTAQLLVDLHRAAAGREFSASDVLRWIEGDDRGHNPAPCPELRAAFRDLYGQAWPRDGTPRSKSISTTLKHRRDMTRDGFRLVMREIAKEGAKFRVIPDAED